MSLNAPPPMLLGPDGLPIRRNRPENKKAPQPITGNAFGSWAGRDITFAQLPGGGVVQFDLSKLTVADFRNMRDHYQVNASLSVLSFMQHQSDFHVECEDKKIADFCNEQLHNIWTQLNRGMSQANWAGYSPMVLEWDNNVLKRQTDLDKVKDLIPEECRVNWAEEEGWAPPGRVKPKFKKYDGIRQIPGTGWPIPVDNTLWFPMLMENGDYYGRKLLRPAFQSWFFSMLVHLFANRYYERFGEPVPIGRAPFDDQVDTVDRKNIPGQEYMLGVLQDLRSRSVVVLPNDHDVDGNGRPMYEYDVHYLESQMRGADFERYMTRLDEEVSLALFTPILLMRTADVGSYDLGRGHMQLYLWMMNAMNGDRAFYIDEYVLNRMVDYNFSPNAPRAKIKFEKLDNKNSEMQKDIVVQLIKNGTVGVDLIELGQQLGMTLHEIRQTTGTDPEPDETDDPTDPPAEEDGGDGGPGSANNRVSVRGMKARQATGLEIRNRVKGQVDRAFRENRFGPDMQINLGFRNRMARAMEADGLDNADYKVLRLYESLDQWLSDVVPLGQEEFSNATEFVDLFYQVLVNELASIK